ncbi:MalY/PatB family protein [Wenxinia saemankumensis]|uniref:cysteine-S-conjugate beta-lyase n=1 Tax=Wenxinia saemankumensis TaxID=1447782 RepID=A0A1M6EHD7_9RHOB|nr:aminotransferase class I/II-fold pyridoxal phosphate-dependent enzyme [Wenxinia saemankumensis]SHI84698.1 cystathione beta-lyase [Wenxinia saemankumensis]
MFDDPKPRRGTGSTKWDGMAMLMGPDVPGDAIPMWVAQMDFDPPPPVERALMATVAAGELGYFTTTPQMFEATAWWMETRHGWAADPGQMFATHGLGNAIGLLLQTLTAPGDGVVIFAPVYHEFRNKIARNGRRAVEVPLAIGSDGVFGMDLDAAAAILDGTERMVIISAPHNPAGRVWTVEELRALAAFSAERDLILVSDEIHQDLTLPGFAHVPALTAAPEHRDRIVVLTAASKTFDIAGLRTGCAHIPDAGLRETFGQLHRALDIQPNRMGVEATRAAYSPEGAEWVDALVAHLDGNRQAWEAALAAIPGVSAMPMQGTYLSWVDFSGTGMDQAEIDRRVMQAARLIPSPGPALGPGGELHHRFNLATTRGRVEEAGARLAEAFSDLQ